MVYSIDRGLADWRWIKSNMTKLTWTPIALQSYSLVRSSTGSRRSILSEHAATVALNAGVSWSKATWGSVRIVVLTDGSLSQRNANSVNMSRGFLGIPFPQLTALGQKDPRVPAINTSPGNAVCCSKLHFIESIELEKKMGPQTLKGRHWEHHHRARLATEVWSKV